MSVRDRRVVECDGPNCNMFFVEDVDDQEWPFREITIEYDDLDFCSKQCFVDWINNY